jgi:acetylornithine deacetylase/succinyl-diaminopimelate desuccinylase-like protein
VFSVFSAISAISALIVVGSLAAFGQPAPKFDSSRAWEHLRQLVAIGPVRPSPAIEQRAQASRTSSPPLGLKAVEQAWTMTPLGRVHMVNLIVTIPGANPSRIAITGHYDTAVPRPASLAPATAGRAPFLIELARVLKA